MDFSVLMTTYHGEKPEFLDASLKSILTDQTVKPNQLVLVLDGPVGEELEKVIEKYKTSYNEIIDIIRCDENRGQSKASAEGMKYVKYDLVARMDSDDISVPNRFEKELAVIEKHPEISVVSGWISEFDSDPSKSTSLRIVPESHDEIIAMFPKRMPMNNVTAMIRKKAIEEAGGYGRDTVNEDYSLYSRMWVNGCRFYNIQEVMVNVRVGNGMTQRRGDIRIFKDWCKDQRYLRKHGMQSAFSSWLSCFRCLVFVLMPSGMKTFLYKHFLRKSNEG